MDDSVKKFQGQYSIGLDIGTASVGWACINRNYDILKFRGRPSLGVHVFESAETAEARRLQRGMRRRYNRRIKRIQMLQELFSPLINDESFFSNVNNNHQWKNSNDFEHRTLSESLIELGYSREEIHKTFPTIYHLRHLLITSKEKKDLKLVYLALHNLVKSRGHFLLGDNLSWENRKKQSGTTALEDFLEKLYEENNFEENLSNQSIINIDAVLKKRGMTNNDKQKEIQKSLPKEFKDIGKLLVGLKAQMHNIFYNCDNYEELKEDKLSVKLSDDSDEEDLSLLTDDQEEVIILAKEIYLEMTLDEILGTSEYIAQAKVNDFNKNKKQLKKLKDFLFRNYGRTVMNEFFTSSKDSLRLYNQKPDNKHLGKLSYFDQYRLNKSKGKDKFFKQLKKQLDKSSENPGEEKERKELLDQISNGELLPLLTNVSNASIPYQNSLYEAQRILKKQAAYYPEINDDLIENVKQLISFRIPYYVGPLAKDKSNSDFAWSIRKEDKTVTPFTFNEVIDKATSAENFIKRMTNKCSYLLNEDVLPKHSLLYQEMNVRNELNGINMRYKEEPAGRQYRLPQDIKTHIYEKHFKNTKKVTHKNFKEFLKRSTDGYEDKDLFGTQKENEFASALSSYIDFKEILGQKKLDDHIEEVEWIILWITIFNEKSILKDKIEDNFDFITEDELERILKLDYQGWGRLSKKALTIDSQGESIIDLLRYDDYNFMEAYTSVKHDFEQIFKEENRSNSATKKIKYEDIAELKCSPALRKSIWSSIKIVEELVSIFGEPENIILEFAREEGEKKRTKPWEDKWKEIVKDNLLVKQEEFKPMFDEIKAYGDDNLDYKMEKLRLYLMQGGKCLYTLEKINLKSLMQHETSGGGYYEIDHILPRNFVKDDSFNNKALVVKKANQRKSGENMPLKLDMNKTRKGALIHYWDKLVENGMMSSSKKFRLMKEEFTEMDKERFIARQLVETRQISVHVRNLLEERFNTENNKKVQIEVLKAGMISEVRRKLNIPKIRNLNDNHHAVDALLTAGTFNFGERLVPGLFKFSIGKHKLKQKWDNENLKSMNKPNFNKELFLVTAMRKNDIGSGKTFETIIKQVLKDSFPIITKKPGSSEGAFYKQSIFSPREKEPKYSSEKTKKFVHVEIKNAYGALIKYFIENKKGELVSKVELIDVTNIEDAQNNFQNPNDIAEFYAKKSLPNNKVHNPQLILKIHKGDLIYINENPFYYVSKGELVNAKQLKLNLNDELRLHKLLNNKWQYEEEEAKEIYEILAEEIIKQYSHVLPTQEKKYKERTDRIKNYFEETSLTHDDFVNSVNELLKVSSPSPARSEKLGGRFTTSATTIIKSGKYSTTSITGLKYKKPKSIIKFME